MPSTSLVKLLGVKDKSWMGKVISFVRGSPYNHMAIMRGCDIFEMTPRGVSHCFDHGYIPEYTVIHEFEMKDNQFNLLIEAMEFIKYDWLSLLLWIINHCFNTDFDDSSRMNCVEFVSSFCKDGVKWNHWAPDQVVNYYLSRRV